MNQTFTEFRNENTRTVSNLYLNLLKNSSKFVNIATLNINRSSITKFLVKNQIVQTTIVNQVLVIKKVYKT